MDTKEIIKSLMKEKKIIQGSKNLLGNYSMKQMFRLIEINDKLRELKNHLGTQ